MFNLFSIFVKQKKNYMKYLILVSFFILQACHSQEGKFKPKEFKEPIAVTMNENLEVATFAVVVFGVPKPFF